MKKLSVIAIVAAGLTLAGGGRWAAAMSQFDWGSAASMGFEDANGNASLPAYSQIIVAALHPGVTESQVQSDFAVGNVSKILTQDFDVYNWAPLGWSGGCGPTGLNYQGGAVDLDTMAPAGLVNVEADVSVQNTTMMSYFASKEVYYLAINGTCTYPASRRRPTACRCMLSRAASPRWESGARNRYRIRRAAAPMSSRRIPPCTDST